MPTIFVYEFTTISFALFSLCSTGVTAGGAMIASSEAIAGSIVMVEMAEECCLKWMLFGMLFGRMEWAANLSVGDDLVNGFRRRSRVNILTN